MNNSMLFIVVGSTVAFVGIIVWKAVWFMKKINSVPVKEESD